MKVPFATHAFTAGVLAPAFHGRVDLDKYDLGVAQAENFFVDFRGGLSTRAGTEYLLNLEEYTRLFEFKLRADQDSIIILMNASYFRFFQTDSLLVDDEGDPITIESPYSAEELEQVQFKQTSLSGYFTHPNHWPQKLSFNPALNEWDIEPVNFSARVDFKAAFPTLGNAKLKEKEAAFTAAVENNFNLTAAYEGENKGEDAAIIFTLSAVDSAGIETLSKSPIYKDGFKNYTLRRGSMTFTWDAVSGAEFYRLYRSSVISDGEVDFSQPLGLIAETRGTSFIDDNVVPDYAITPRTQYNPFANGAIIEIEVLTKGSGYGKSAALTVGDGYGFVGYPIVRDGEVVSIKIQSPGAGFSLSSQVIIVDPLGGGTGATARVSSVTPASGNYPRAFTRFQQHGVYAGSNNIPSGIWGSRRGLLDNFDKAETITAEDAYFFSVDSTPVDPIEHLVPLRDSLLLFHPYGVERLRASEGQAVTALSSVIEQQAALGAGPLSPIVINNDVLFALRQGTSFYSLVYTYYTNSFSPQDIAVLSSHLFEQGGEPVSYAWQEEPNRLLYTALADGSALTLTYLREQEIFAWTKHTTQGEFKQFLSVNGKKRTEVFTLVHREINGSTYWALERFKERKTEKVEDYWGVDCGLELPAIYPAASLTYDKATQTVTASSAIFSSADVGKVLRFRSGIFDVIAAPTTSSLTLEERTPAKNKLGSIAQGEWTLDSPVTEVYGLWHLNGATVSVLADGDALLEQKVEDGKLTLGIPATRVIVGLPFEALVETLPLFSPQVQSEGKKKRIVGTAIRLNETRGLSLGTSLSRMYEMKDRSYEGWGEVTQYHEDNTLVLHAARWERDARLFAQQRYPLPATILGLVTEAEVEG